MLTFEKIVVFFLSKRENIKIVRLSLIAVILLFIGVTALPQEIKKINKSIIQSKVIDTASKFQTIKNVIVLPPPKVDSNKTQLPITASLQEASPISKNVYQKFQKPDTTLKYQVIKDGKVLRTATAKLEDIRVPINEKIIIPYKKEILPVDEVTYQRLRSNFSLPFTRADLKVIPEINIDSANKNYDLYFFPYQSFLYNDSLKKFVTKMGFFFVKSDLSGTNLVSIEPVSVVITSESIQSITPRPLKISHLNFPASDVDLMGKQLIDSAEIKVITISKPEGYKAFIRVSPALEISTNRTSIQGYGIQKIPIEVGFIGSSSSDSVRVSLSVGKGTVTPNSVMVSYNSPQTVYLISEGLGNAKLSANSGNLVSNDLQFAYVFPWFFILASMLGGLIGGLAKYYSGSESKTFSLKPFIGGILIGLIGAAAYYALGINLLGISFSAELNEIAVFGLSALCTYFGISRKKEAA